MKRRDFNLAHRIANLRWIPVRHWFDVRQAMQLRVSVQDPQDGRRYSFVADSLHAYQRARQHLSKEPDTIAWLRQNIRPADVFLDIGANVGTFSIFAGKHMSAEGHVYACEPHLPTTVQLMQNVAANNLGSIISILSVAASGEDGFLPFRYKRWRSGASGSQLGLASAPSLDAPVGTELKCGMTVDTMIKQGIIRAPDLVKIDTDGIEMPILAGMRNLFASRGARSVLVEVQAGQYDQQIALMHSFGYALADTHVTGKWKRKQERGAELNELDFNAIYTPT